MALFACIFLRALTEIQILLWFSRSTTLPYHTAKVGLRSAGAWRSAWRVTIVQSSRVQSVKLREYRELSQLDLHLQT